MVSKNPGIKLDRSELLRNINRFLKTDYSSLSDLSDGVAFAQILHACLPDHLPLCKVNFNVKNKLQALKNLSIIEETLKSSDLLKSCPKHKIASQSLPEISQFLRWCWTLLTTKYDHVLDTYRADEWRNAFHQIVQAERLDSPDHCFESNESNPDSEMESLCKQLEGGIALRMSALKESLKELTELQSKSNLLHHDLTKLKIACEQYVSHPLAMRILSCINRQHSDTRIIKTIG